MGLSTEMVKHLIHDHGADPARLGRLAHRVVDSVVLDEHRIAIKTPRWGWRIIDERSDSKRKVRPAKGRKQPAARVSRTSYVQIFLQLEVSG